MKIWLQLFFYTINTTLKLLRPNGTKAIIAENMILKQQLIVLSRNKKRCPPLQTSDRFIFGFLTAFISFKRLSKISVILQPTTLLNFHKLLVKKKYSKLFSNKNLKRPGPRCPNQELINLVLEMKRNNPRFSYRRIAMQITNAFGIDLNKDIVRRILNKYYKSNGGGNGPSWLTFIGHMKDSLWSIDLFRCESMFLKTHWVMVIMDQFTRRIVGIATHRGYVNGIDLCCMFNKIIANKKYPKYLSSDNDPLFKFRRWQANLRIFEIEEIKSVPYAPRTHPFIERLIGTIRREFLDQILFWTENDLKNKLNNFQRFYNIYRSHWSLEAKTPEQKATNKVIKLINFKNYRWKSYCHGLVKLPIAA